MIAVVPRGIQDPEFREMPPVRPHDRIAPAPDALAFTALFPCPPAPVFRPLQEVPTHVVQTMIGQHCCHLRVPDQTSTIPQVPVFSSAS